MNILRQNALFFLVILMTLRGNAQIMPSIMPDTPESSALIKRVEHPMNYSSGVPNISIPLHILKAGKMRIPISLSYQSGGFKATEQEGVVGLGWSLSTDIQITRVVNGLDDFCKPFGEYKYGNYYYQDGSDYYYGVVKDPYKIAFYVDYRGYLDKEPDKFYYSLLSGRSGAFYINSGGTNIRQVPYTGVKIEILDGPINISKAGVFKVTDIDGTEYYYGTDDSAIEVNSGNLSEMGYVEVANYGSPYISSWKCTKIVSPNKKESVMFYYSNQIETYSFNSKDFIECHYRYDLSSEYFLNTANEYEILDKISCITPYSSKVLTNGQYDIITAGPYYDLQEINARYADTKGYYGKNIFDSEIYYIKHNSGQCGSCVVVPSLESDDIVIYDNKFRTQLTVRKQTRKKLSRIETANGCVNYNYSVDPNSSTYGQLEEINIKSNYNNEKIIKKIKFKQTATIEQGVPYDMWYQYFCESRTSYLDGIIIYNGKESLPYSFEYCSRPAFCNYSKSQNIWGAWEGGSSGNHFGRNLSLGSMAIDPMVWMGDMRRAPFAIGSDFKGSGQDVFLRHRSEPYYNSFAGVLYSITYPTNLVEEFFWEQNSFYNYKKKDWKYNFEIVGHPAGGCRIQKILSRYTSPGGYPATIKTRTFKYGKNESGIGYLKRPISNTMHHYAFVNIGYYYHMGNNEWFYPLSAKDIKYLEAGNSKPEHFDKKYYGVNYYETFNYDVLNVRANPHFKGYLYDQYIDNYSSTYNSTCDDGWKEIGELFVTTNDPSKAYKFDYIKSEFVASYFSNTHDRQPFSLGYPVYYDIVTEYIEDNYGVSEKVVYTYNNNSTVGYGNDVIFGIGNGNDLTNGLYNINIEYSPYRDYLYGHLIKREDYEAIDSLTIDGRDSTLYRPVRTINNYYDFISKGSISLNQRYFQYRTNAPMCAALYEFDSKYFKPVYGGEVDSRHALLERTVEVKHNNGGDVTTVIEYSYNYDILLPISIQKYGSEKLIEKEINYSINNPLLKAQYRLIDVIEENVWVNFAKQSTTKYIYSNNWLEDKSLVALRKVQHSKGTESLEDRIIYYSYDSNGNPKEISKNDDYHSVFYWGYNKEFPVAKIDNYKNLLLEVNSSLKVSLDQLDDYTEITIYNKDALKALNISIRKKLPYSSMITTYTYDPLIGVTSETDPNGITTYFEYDELGRLSIIRDNKWNILKKYEYNNNRK